MSHNLTLPEEIERVMAIMAGDDMDADTPDDAQPSTNTAAEDAKCEQVAASQNAGCLKHEAYGLSYS